MTIYGYARVSVKETDSRNLTLQVEQLVRAGVSLSHIHQEEASGARTDRAALLELLGRLEEGDTLVVTHIDRLARSLIYGLQTIEGLHRGGVNFRSLAEEIDTRTANGKLQLSVILAFAEWYRNSTRERSVDGQQRARAHGRIPGRPASTTPEQDAQILEALAQGVSQTEVARRMGISRDRVIRVERNGKGRKAGRDSG